MIGKPQKNAFLHLYAQAMQHDEAIIIGNMDGLKALRDAVDAAISQHKGTGSASCFSSDAEGYDLHVLLATEDEAKHLSLPYTDRELTGCSPGNSVTPQDIYRRINGQ
jgi:hypothetical protein